MKYSIVYSSRTGNTALLAQTIRDQLPDESCLWYGSPNPAALEADLIFVGFWTDKGSCDDTIAEFLRTLRGKELFFFGTAGFGESQSYFDQILTRVQKNLDPSNTVAGQFLCQGKMPASVRTRYESCLDKEPEKMSRLIENFDRALSHPDTNDLLRLREAAAPHIH